MLNKIIFVNYTPGSYGSFLHHCLKSSDDCYGKSANIFNYNGAAHNNLTQFIKRFHDGENILEWESLSHENRVRYLKEHTVFPPDFVSNNKYYIHRLTIPRLSSLISTYFEGSKFINITYDDVHIPRIARDMANKTFIENGRGWLYRVRDQHPEFFKELMKMTKEQMIEKYYESSLSYVKTSQFKSDDDKIYNFDYANFLDKELFLKEIDRLFSFLTIAKVNVNILYDEFAKVNKI